MIGARGRCYLAVFLSMMTLSQSVLAKQKPQQKVVLGYFTEGGAASGKYLVKNIVTSGAAPLLTHVAYAFGKVEDNQCQIANRESALEHAYDASTSVNGSDDAPGPNQLRGTFHQLQELKKLYPNLKIVVSFGGWGQSQGFTTAADPEHVQQFVRSCVDTFIAGHFAPGIEVPGIFDGIDIDWEYPVEGGVHSGRPEDKTNFTKLAAEFRRQLDAVRPGLLLTAALPAEAEYYKNFELAEISKSLDMISIMAYDLHWDSEPVTNLHSALFHDRSDPSRPPLDKRYSDYAVRGFLKAGVPPEKIILGVPFYGKGWTGVKDTNGGLYQSATGPAKSPGSYRDLAALPPSARRRYLSKAVTCTVWSNGNFWSYDCPEALRKKTKYARQHRLGGVMFWELSHDSAQLELLHSLTR